jgi:hypothetical protein
MKRVLIKHYDEETDSLHTYDLDINIDSNIISKIMIPTEELTSNDRHSSYSIEGSPKISGIMYKIVHPHLNEIATNNMRFVIESYSTHLDKLKTLPESNYKWIYNIIDNNAETKDVIHQTSEYILIPDYAWDGENLQELHVLGIIREKRLASIREIKQSDLEMLVRIKEESIVKIEEKYDLKQDKIKMFFHYTPSTYLLHIHFVHIEKCNRKTSVEKCHTFDDVVRNISIDPEYYHGDMKIIELYN